MIYNKPIWEWDLEFIEDKMGNKLYLTVYFENQKEIEIISEFIKYGMHTHVIYSFLKPFANNWGIYRFDIQCVHICDQTTFKKGFKFYMKEVINLEYNNSIFYGIT